MSICFKCCNQNNSQKKCKISLFLLHVFNFHLFICVIYGYFCELYKLQGQKLLKLISVTIYIKEYYSMLKRKKSTITLPKNFK